MKTSKKIFAVLLLMVCVFTQGIGVSASGSMFAEVPAEKIGVIEKDDSVQPASLTATLGTCTLDIGVYSSGVGLSFTTRATDTASKIGVKNIVLYEKTLFGWTSIPVSEHYTTNSDYYFGSVIYTQSKPGKTYKATCTHYAIIDGREYTLDNDVSEIVFN